MLITISNITNFKRQPGETLDPSETDPGEGTPTNPPRVPKIHTLTVDLNSTTDSPNQKYSCNKEILRNLKAGKRSKNNHNIYGKIIKHENCFFNNKTKKENNACATNCLAGFGIVLLFGFLAAVFMSDLNENAMSYLASKPDTAIGLDSSNSTNSSQGTIRTLNSINELTNENTGNQLDPTTIQAIKSKFSTVSFTGSQSKPVEVHVIPNYREIYPKGMTEDMKDILKDNRDHRKHDVKVMLRVDNDTKIPTDTTIIYENVYWGPRIENALPQGYDAASADDWEKFVKHSEVIKMENGCGRMQNRLVTFRDGLQACVRYRQNTDQIQGEIFSFYVARLLNLTNLAPSVISVVDLKDRLWQNVASDIATAQWNTNRPVVLTQYIPDLESAPIPEAFKPAERHLNKFDVLKMSLKDNDTNVKTVLIDKLRKHQSLEKSGTKTKVEYFDHIDMNVGEKTLKSFIELAQWSDLIIFDYLTANLDRIVNNLFNFQWNVNIMDGPAHNLARKSGAGLLMFLDNESGLLHGYRLLKKYNVYHSLMLDNLCVFRRTTVDYLKMLHDNQSIGSKIHEMFRAKNNAVIRDILPPLPEKNVKILFERIGKVLSQVQKCEQSYSKR